ncbi:hypothetical protein KI387_014119, partial [Taxus chinensis]
SCFINVARGIIDIAINPEDVTGEVTNIYVNIGMDVGEGAGVKNWDGMDYVFICKEIGVGIVVSEVVEIYVLERGVVGIDVEVSDVDVICVFDEGIDVRDLDVVIVDMVEMIADIGGVDVVVGVFDVDVVEGKYVRDVGIGEYIGTKDEYDVIDWGMIEVDEVGGIVKVDVDVVRV